jgi:prephenate dehydrogenase
LISFSISNSILKKENKYDILSLSSGGFESISRLAKSSPIMWEEIFRDNKTNVLEALENFNNELNLFKKNIEDDNWEDLNKQMVFSNTLYELFGKNK